MWRKSDCGKVGGGGGGFDGHEAGSSVGDLGRARFGASSSSLPLRPRHASQVCAATSSPSSLCLICPALPLTNQPKQGRTATGKVAGVTIDPTARRPSTAMGGAEEAVMLWRSAVVEQETTVQARRARDLCVSILLLPRP